MLKACQPAVLTTLVPTGCRDQQVDQCAARTWRCLLNVRGGVCRTQDEAGTGQDCLSPSVFLPPLGCHVLKGACCTPLGPPGYPLNAAGEAMQIRAEVKRQNFEFFGSFGFKSNSHCNFKLLFFFFGGYILYRAYFKSKRENISPPSSRERQGV